MTNNYRLSIIAFIVGAVALGIGALLLFRGSSGKQTRYVAYVGRYTNKHDTIPLGKQTQNKFDVMHELVLRDRLAELSRQLPTFDLQLKTFDCQQDSVVSDSIYRSQIAPDSTIVAVIDNTWGAHIRGCAGTIRAQEIPVIAINADKNGLDFGDGAIFTGNNDNLPSDISTFISKVLKKSSVNFISESDYPLHDEYLRAFAKDSIALQHLVVVSGKSDSVEAEKKRLFAAMRDLKSTGALDDGTFWVINVHSKTGTDLLRFLDTSFTGLNLIGHAYIADMTKINDFGTSSDNRLILVTNPTDAVSVGLTLAGEKYRSSYPEVFGNYNSPLFLKRCQDAVELLRYSVIGRKDSMTLTRGTVGTALRRLRDTAIRGEDDIYTFTHQRELVQDIFFTELRKGRFFTYHQQLNAERQVVPTLVFGLDITDIYDVDVNTNSFKADFYYWVKLDTGDRDAEKYILFQNMKASESTKDPVFEKITGSTLYKLYKVSGNFHANYNLRDYPLDYQEIIMSFEIVSPTDKLKIAFDQSGFQQDKNLLERFRVRAWDKLKYYLTVDNRITSTMRGDPEGKEGSLNKFPVFSFRLLVKRNLMGPFLEIVLPLVLIGLVAIALLYIRDISFENLGEVSVGTFLGIITFSIALSNITPSSDYLTKADYLFWLTFLVVLISFMTTIVLNSIYDVKDLHPSQTKGVRIMLTILYPVAVAAILLL